MYTSTSRLYFNIVLLFYPTKSKVCFTWYESSYAADFGNYKKGRWCRW